MQLNYKVYGEGEPVIILHGLFGMLDNWQSFAKKLAQSHKVFLIDQRDHGKSPHTDAFNYILLAEDLKDFLDQQELAEARLIGHSMGGKTILEFAKKHSDLIRQMAVVDIGVKSYPGGHEYLIEAMMTAPIKTATSRKEIEEHLSKSIEEWGVRQFLMKNLKRDVDRGGFRWKMNLYLLKREYENILASIELKTKVQADTLFVRALRSKYITEEDKPKLKACFKNFQMVEMDTGHWVHAEKPDALLELILEFFRT